MLAQDYCRAKLGKLDLAIHPRSFQEVKAHNAAGQCWLVLDGEYPRPAYTRTVDRLCPAAERPSRMRSCPEPALPIVANFALCEGQCRSVMRLASDLTEAQGRAHG